MSAIAVLLDQLESIWTDLDEVLSDLDDAGWNRRHGRDWTFRDIPFHSSYFDEEMIAQPIEMGDTVPEDHQVFSTLAELDAWNDAHFEHRPVDRSPDQLMDDMRRARQRIRDVVAHLDEGTLGDPVLLRLPGSGWSSVEDALRLAQIHAWNHFAEAKLRLRRSGPTPNPAVVHTALQSNIHSMPIALDRTVTANPLVAQMSVGGDGGGDWTIDVRDHICTVVDGVADQPDLTMRYRDAESFAAAIFQVVHPMRLMLSRRLRVKGVSKLGSFATLFPAPPRT